MSPPTPHPFLLTVIISIVVMMPYLNGMLAHYKHMVKLCRHLDPLTPHQRSPLNRPHIWSAFIQGGRCSCSL